MRFSPHTLGNLIHRTRLRLAAAMLHFQEYGDFADYFGSRWHYLGAIIAAIPVLQSVRVGLSREDFSGGTQ